jgi:nicotinic acetylcholine receptor
MYPVNVTVGQELQRVSSISLAESSMEVFIWHQLSWEDPRLRWDPAEWGGVTQINIIGSSGDPEVSEIWVPDIELYNQVESVNEFSDKIIQVWAGGNVYYSRPGRLMVLCDFDGLEMFPFDTLGCSWTLGGWAQSGYFVNYQDPYIKADKAKSARFQECVCHEKPPPPNP